MTLFNKLLKVHRSSVIAVFCINCRIATNSPITSWPRSRTRSTVSLWTISWTRRTRSTPRISCIWFYDMNGTDIIAKLQDNELPRGSALIIVFEGSSNLVSDPGQSPGPCRGWMGIAASDNIFGMLISWICGITFCDEAAQWWSPFLGIGNQSKFSLVARVPRLTCSR